MNTKRRFTRAVLEDNKRCVLCGGIGWHPQGKSVPIRHKDDCVLADMSVSAITVVKSRASIVFRMDKTGRRWWWTSESSDKEYHIEKLPGRYVMFDAAGNTIVERQRLCDIRANLALNQGRY